MLGEPRSLRWHLQVIIKTGHELDQETLGTFTRLKRWLSRIPSLEQRNFPVDSQATFLGLVAMTGSTVFCQQRGDIFFVADFSGKRWG